MPLPVGLGQAVTHYRLSAESGISRNMVYKLATPEPTAGLEAVMAELRTIRALVEHQAEEIRELKALPVTGNVAELERRNTYLEGELKRRDEQPQARRPWWRVWG